MDRSHNAYSLACLIANDATDPREPVNSAFRPPDAMLKRYVGSVRLHGAVRCGSMARRLTSRTASRSS